MIWLRFLVAAAIIAPAFLWTTPHHWLVTAVIAVVGVVAGRLAERAARSVQDTETSRRRLVFGTIAAVVTIGVAAAIAGAVLRGEAITGSAKPPGKIPPPPVSPSVEQPIEVVLGSDGSLFVAGEPAVLREVPQRLQKLDIDRGVLVVTGEDVDREELEALVEQLSAAGIEKFALRTER